MASTRDWFESVAEARRRARRRLPRPVFQAIEAGAEAGVTRDDNVRAFTEIRFAPPRVASPRGGPRWPVTRDLRTNVLGTDISLPVIASPAGVQAVHPSGEAGIALGTARAGTAMGLSEFASMPVADVTPVNPSLFFQVHWSADKQALYSRAERGVAPVHRPSFSRWTGPSPAGATGAAHGCPSGWTWRRWRATRRRPWPGPGT